ncbi:tumor necrosis factor receptor superfamily member 13B [Toxotes jaculatrix]|uniref:tumor necrosis factor receptor superfamily member 13B n=1 Tax=Toxotes jaculatrix TaxID=941984 RepID=UPI001B3A9F48|nr:tumor necrosis factor receptor superfamily member 13B [Toxotes jaculatrix]
MGGSCPDGQYWDYLVKQCMQCHLECHRPETNAKCISYCEPVHCKALPGHFYDSLLKKCMSCADVCGSHPAECSHLCQTTPPPATTQTLLFEVTTRVPPSKDSTLLLYSLLVVCTVLLFSSVSLTLAVFLRGSRTKTSNKGPKETSQNQKRVVQPGVEGGLPGGHLGKTTKDVVTSSSCHTDREPSDDSSPTETCVCAHCFPDLKALGPGNDRPLRAPFSFYQQAVFPRAPIQKGGPLWPEESLHSCGVEVQEEAAIR